MILRRALLVNRVLTTITITCKKKFFILQSVPVLINRNRDDLFVAVAAGSRFSLAVNYQNQAVAWGSSEYGKVGHRVFSLS